MGVYIFKRDVLVSLLHENEGHFGSDAGPDTHFGHDVMPHALREGFTVVAHHFDGYWRVGPQETCLFCPQVQTVQQSIKLSNQGANRGKALHLAFALSSQNKTEVEL